jgi:threonyl-tRNA synthetase
MAQQELTEIEKKRHSAAHLLAMAVLDTFPEVKLGIGPTIENGFYYDFELPAKISPDHLPKLEKKMKELIKRGLGYERSEPPIAEAIALFEAQPFKQELLNELARDEAVTISLYKTGDFTDLCRGGHVTKTSEINPEGLHLTKVAGAYWKGDENRPMLQRVYGVLFDTKEELNTYLQRIEDAERRDHKKLGRELDLFTFSELVGSGLPLWTPKGTLLRTLLDDYVWELRKAKGYQKVTIPHITKKDLYIKSGHWSKFAEELFRIQTREGHEFAMKPMNCPHHTQIFDSRPRSYRDMPQRYCETTMVYRDEQTGELSGLSRVRSITQDDAHVFCRKAQVKYEALAIWDIIDQFYKTFGFELTIRLSRHDPEQFDKYLGTRETWELAENQLLEVIKEKGAEYFDGVGEAAMYGPKIDFMGKDALGRLHQVATIQLDFNQPEGFDLFCINEAGEKERIVMIHAAIMGSIERFLSVLIEHYAGAFPTWLSPVQVAVIPVSDKFNIYAAEHVVAPLIAAGIRVEMNDANESVGKKIRYATTQKTPYILVVGEKEIEASTVAVRSRDNGELGGMSLSDLLAKLTADVANRSL